MSFKKERHELTFRIQLNIYDGAYLQNQLKAKSFIVVSRQDSKYPSDERNKLLNKRNKQLSYCFCKAAQGQLLQWRNTVLRAVVKSHKSLKGTKVFCLWVLQPGIVYKKQSKGYSVNFLKKETLTQRLLHKYFPVSFEKSINTALNSSARLPLK